MVPIKTPNAMTREKLNSDGPPRRTKINKTKNGHDLVLYYKGDILAEEYRAERQRKHIERVTPKRETQHPKRISDQRDSFFIGK